MNFTRKNKKHKKNRKNKTIKHKVVRFKINKIESSKKFRKTPHPKSFN